MQAKENQYTHWFIEELVSIRYSFIPFSLELTSNYSILHWSEHQLNAMIHINSKAAQVLPVAEWILTIEFYFVWWMPTMLVTSVYLSVCGRALALVPWMYLHSISLNTRFSYKLQNVCGYSNRNKLFIIENSIGNNDIVNALVQFCNYRSRE